MLYKRIKVIKQKRGRPRVSTVVWSLICDEVWHHPEETRKALAAEIERKLKLKGEASPTQQTLLKMITKARYSESSPEDYLWHLDAFDKYPVPADVLPIILEIQKHIDKNLSIRLVKWLTRLYVVLRERKFLKGNESLYCFYCYLWASMYADHEKISEVSKSFGTPISFDSTDLDAGLLDDNPFSLPTKPFVLDLLSTGVSWSIGADEDVLSEEQKEHWGMLLAQKIEEALIGHNLGGSESGKPGAGKAWLFYLSNIINAFRLRYFEGLSKEEVENFLLQIRKALPEFLEASLQADHDSSHSLTNLKRYGKA